MEQHRIGMPELCQVFALQRVKADAHAREAFGLGVRGCKARQCHATPSKAKCQAASERGQKQSLERIDYCIDLRAQQSPKLAAWLKTNASSSTVAAGAGAKGR